MNDTRKLATEVIDELQAQKQRIWNMANDLFQVLQVTHESLNRYHDTESEVLALIETTLNKYTKRN